jgi:hypothetical protein
LSRTAAATSTRSSTNWPTPSPAVARDTGRPGRRWRCKSERNLSGCAPCFPRHCPSSGCVPAARFSRERAHAAPTPRLVLPYLRERDPLVQPGSERRGADAGGVIAYALMVLAALAGVYRLATRLRPRWPDDSSDALRWRRDVAGVLAGLAAVHAVQHEIAHTADWMWLGARALVHVL